MTAHSIRVLFVVPGEGQGSSMIFVRRQAESLAREGVQVESFYLRSRTSPLALVREFRRLRSHLAAFQPSIVHAHFGTVTAVVAALAARGLPLVITYRGGDLNPPVSLRSCLGGALSQLAALRAARIVCVSRRLRDRLWWRRGQVTILPSGVDAELFHPEPRAAARARLAWGPEERVVLFNAGHDPRNKRLDLARQAEVVAQRILLEQRLPPLRIEVLHGEVDPWMMPTLMNASDCLLIASDSEGSPTVLQEALACGLPVVSVDVGDAIERLRGISPSRIVPRDPEVMGRALAEMVAGSALRTPARTNGPQEIGNLTLPHTARVLTSLYGEMLGWPRTRTAIAGER